MPFIGPKRQQLDLSRFSKFGPIRKSTPLYINLILSSQTIKPPLPPSLLSPNTTSVLPLLVTMAAWDVPEAFLVPDCDELAAHLNAQRSAYAVANNIADVHSFKLIYLYTFNEHAIDCVQNRNFQGLPINRWTNTIRIPLFGPIGPWNWFLAVPLDWYTANATNDQTLHNAVGFPVVAWGPVLLSRT
ncbi:hypothetical protein pRL70066 (plasmid) [Rhizobium johnstonii 3841]|uniref:Uncharacterized protein n=1 Tax=Rhizobium johnstonii (strain DSM 114642 / LMG 32736 / 3841) TaxID=216596 RepID=Q1M9V7_RHIJ3|nr:hypothetical protein pRL70066 [Rhizobium johnstonii 3841]